MLQFQAKSSINEAGPRVLETLATPDLNAPLEETQMANAVNIGLRGDSASVEKSENWKSIGELARKLAEKAAAGAVGAEALRDLLVYDGITGKLFWKQRSASMFNGGSQSAANAWNSLYAGQQAFTAITSGGYNGGTIFGKSYLAHRIIWALVTGAFPENEIDHADGDRTNNKFENLRPATRSENSQNVKFGVGVSGFRGVSKNGKGWAAKIMSGGTRHHLGTYATKEAASAAYNAAATKLHMGFALSQRGEWL